MRQNHSIASSEETLVSSFACYGAGQEAHADLFWLQDKTAVSHLFKHMTAVTGFSPRVSLTGGDKRWNEDSCNDLHTSLSDLQCLATSHILIKTKPCINLPIKNTHNRVCLLYTEKG